MRFAVIDLGTNTFNLLIAEKIPGESLSILLNTKEAVKLGEGGIHQRIITEAAFQRGLDAMGRHFEKIKAYHVDHIRAFATSAIRDASNGDLFADVLRSTFNLEVSVISGEEEAELIYQGVKQTLPFHDKKFLILDIGGGSNEFIIANHTKIFWKKSFPLGMARLLEQFKPQSPITPQEITRIEAYFHQELPELFVKIKHFQPEKFIGASGSFDSFVTILNTEGLLTNPPEDNFHEIPLATFDRIYQKLIQTTLADRQNMTFLEPVRKDMIVLATLFVNYVLKQFKFESVYQSAYSLKEGALSELIQTIEQSSIAQ